MSLGNPWLQRQRKSDLIEIAERVGLPDYEDLLKTELEHKLDEFLAQNSARYSADTKLTGYWNSRARITGSPVKRELTGELKAARKRITRAIEELSPNARNDSEASSGDEQSPVVSQVTQALAETPARALQLAQRIPLPATPADVVAAVDRNTVAIRERAASLYEDSGIVEGTERVRDGLSTIKSIYLATQIFELYFLRPEVLSDRYAFTIPAIKLLGTTDYPVHLPDMFLILTAGFWSPVLLYFATSLLIPAIAGYFFNLSAANHNHPGRGRARTSQPNYSVDPLTFSIAKALITFVVYNQGVTFGGLVNELSVARINSALYGGWKGVVTDAAIVGITAFYDAVLKK